MRPSLNPVIHVDFVPAPDVGGPAMHVGDIHPDWSNLRWVSPTDHRVDLTGTVNIPNTRGSLRYSWDGAHLSDHRDYQARYVNNDGLLNPGETIQLPPVPRVRLQVDEDYDFAPGQSTGALNVPVGVWTDPGGITVTWHPHPDGPGRWTWTASITNNSATTITDWSALIAATPLRPTTGQSGWLAPGTTVEVPTTLVTGTQAPATSTGAAVLNNAAGAPLRQSWEPAGVDPGTPPGPPPVNPTPTPTPGPTTPVPPVTPPGGTPPAAPVTGGGAVVGGSNAPAWADRGRRVRGGWVRRLRLPADVQAVTARNRGARSKRAARLPVGPGVIRVRVRARGLWLISVTTPQGVRVLRWRTR